MAREDDVNAVAEALDRLNGKLDSMLASGKRGRGRGNDDDGPQSVRSLERGRGADPLDVQGVLFQLRVPVGRRGETMPAFLLFPPVRDEREVEELAEDVERKFKFATVYQPRNERNGYSNGSGYERGRDYSRDRQRR